MARKMEALDLQKTGQAAYEAKKYPEALDTFSKAIALARKWSPSDILPILDQRVAVYVKLRKLEQARQDAIAMVRADKADARGYLRCGQLDRLEGNTSSALRWYEHGLKQVPKSDRTYDSIVAQHEKVKVLFEKEVILSNSRDPVAVLPSELVQLVLGELEYIDVVKALRVSKAWKAILSQLRPLVDTIDFSDARRTINYKMMVAALKRLGPTPRVLVMKDLAKPAIKILKLNLERWRTYTQLEELAIMEKPSSTPFSTDPSTVCCLLTVAFQKYSLKSLEIKHGTLPDRAVLDIMKACKSLQIARFYNVSRMLRGDPSAVTPLHCPNLRVLELGGPESRRLMIDALFFSQFPNLEQLECHELEIASDKPELFDLSAHSCLRKLKFYGCSLFSWPILPPTIEVWDNSKLQPNSRNWVPDQKLGSLSSLRYLRFHEMRISPEAHTFLPDPPAHSITHLDLRGTAVGAGSGPHWPPQFDMAGAIKDGHLANLRELAMGGLQDDLHVIESLQDLRKLEALSLTASRISGSTLIDIVKSLKSLRQVTLIDATNVSAEAIEWARSRGVAMHVKESEHSQNIRRSLHLSG